MGLRIQDRNEIVKGVPVVEPGDDLFWFNRPRLILFLVSFVLFQNAFELAFFAWTWYTFGLRSCFHEHLEDIIIRFAMGIIIQVLCSYVTLPLYALVTQMGSNMKPTIFNENVARALKGWHHTAKKRIKDHNKIESASVTPTSSRPGTPSRHGMSPVHLLRGHGFYRSEMDAASSTQSIGRDKPEFDDLYEHWGRSDDNGGGSQSPPHFVASHVDGRQSRYGPSSSSNNIIQQDDGDHDDVKNINDDPTNLLELVRVPLQKHEIINIEEQSDFSFVKRLN
ncbi:unnamed protein product [Cuscuta epithymum]|nr:unnamed protein product [Cuscuta epithymum]